MHWFTQHETGGYQTERAALGLNDLWVLYDGRVWHWRVSRDDHDLAEGAERTLADAREQAEAAALKLDAVAPA